MISGFPDLFCLYFVCKHVSMHISNPIFLVLCLATHFPYLFQILFFFANSVFKTYFSGLNFTGPYFSYHALSEKNSRPILFKSLTHSHCTRPILFRSSTYSHCTWPISITPGCNGKGGRSAGGCWGCWELLGAARNSQDQSGTAENCWRELLRAAGNSRDLPRAAGNCRILGAYFLDFDLPGIFRTLDCCGCGVAVVWHQGWGADIEFCWFAWHGQLKSAGRGK